VDPVPDPLLFRKSGSAGNRTQDIWVRSHELSPLVKCITLRSSSIYVRFQDFTAVTMKNAIFLDIKNPVSTSQETYYVSVAEASRFILC
jgi:hypothetical protein